MGMSYGHYLGPYLYCTTDQIVPIKTILGCSSDVCDLIKGRREFKRREKFCPECGSPAAELQVPSVVRDAVYGWALTEATAERICQYNGNNAEPGIHLMIPNQDWPRPFSQDDEVGEVLRVQPELIAKETTWFVVEFEAEIAKAREIYGADRVDVRWGLLGQYG